MCNLACESKLKERRESLIFTLHELDQFKRIKVQSNQSKYTFCSKLIKNFISKECTNKEQAVYFKPCCSCML